MLELKTILKGLSEYYGKQLKTSEAMIYANLLAGYSAESIQAAVNKHMLDPERGRFFPKVADLMHFMPNTSGHIGADEAWSIALASFDESETVTTTAEIARCAQIAREVYNEGDKVGARMAFKESYTREMRESQTPVKWYLSLGHDTEKRSIEQSRAVNAGLLPAPKESDAVMLPAPETGADSPKISELVNDILKRLSVDDESQAEKRHAELMEDRRKTQERKEELLKQAREWMKGRAESGAK